METLSLPRAASFTHQHLLAVVNTRVTALKDERQTIRICDIGCGDGRLLSYMARMLPTLHATTKFEFFGVEVDDSKVQVQGFFDRTIAQLESDVADVDWKKRLTMISSKEDWPFADESIDIIVSNQVIEHVMSHRHFFGEVHRTLTRGGFSVHLFPPRENIWEGHLQMPFVHFISQHTLRVAYIKAMIRLGFGKFKSSQQSTKVDLEYYANSHSDYIAFMTNYLSCRQLLEICKSSGLRADFAFSDRYYYEKLRGKMGSMARHHYGPTSLFGLMMTSLFYKRIASVTLNTEKRQQYDR